MKDQDQMQPGKENSTLNLWIVIPTHHHCVRVYKIPRIFLDKGLIIHWINFTVRYFIYGFCKMICILKAEDWRTELQFGNWANGNLLMIFMNTQCLLKNLWVEIFVTLRHSGKGRSQPKIWELRFKDWDKTQPDVTYDL